MRRYRVEVEVIEPDPVKDPSDRLTYIRNELHTLLQTNLDSFQRQSVEKLHAEVIRFDSQIKASRTYGVSADSPKEALAQILA